MPSLAGILKKENIPSARYGFKNENHLVTKKRERDVFSINWS